jgi:hypothetical protein
MTTTASKTTEKELLSLINGELDPKDFPHPEHLRFAYEMLARHPFSETVALFSAGLKKLAAKTGRPELYHDTVTVGFLALIAERRARSGSGDWVGFMEENSDLLDKHCLRRWYGEERLSSKVARETFILPSPIERRRLLGSIERYAGAFGLLIICSSVITFLQTYSHETAVAWLAAVEIMGAVLFLFKQTRVWALVILLLVFSIAIVATVLAGESPIRFLIYAASALFVWRLGALLRDRPGS